MIHELPEFQKEAKRAEGTKPIWAQCGHCKRWWDDSLSTSLTPVPSGRCPFEYEHEYDKMRPIEMAIAYGDGTWKSGVIVDISNEVPDDRVKFAAMQVVMNRGGEEDVAHIWVYNRMEDSRPEKKKYPSAIPPNNSVDDIPDCPFCNGQRELSGTKGIFSCFSCGRDCP